MKLRHDSETGDGKGVTRHFFFPDLFLLVGEGALVVAPILTMFRPAIDRTALVWFSLPVLAACAAVWVIAIQTWAKPLRKAALGGGKLPEAVAASAYQLTWSLPFRALLLRTGLWGVIALAHGVWFFQKYGFRADRIFPLVSITCVHAFATNAIRAAWYAVILSSLRARLFTGRSQRQFLLAYPAALRLVALVVWGGTIAGIAAFLYYFLPVDFPRYLGFLQYAPIGILVAFVLWNVVARQLNQSLLQHLLPSASVSMAVAYRKIQALPYRLGLVSFFLWLLLIVMAAVMARARLRFGFDDTVLLCGIATLIAAAASMYEALWHRLTIRPLLEQITRTHHALVSNIRPVLSLRTKLLISFGGVVLLACGSALIWGFAQYKNLVSESIERQAALGLAWLRSEVHAEVAMQQQPPTPSLVGRILHRMDRDVPHASAVFYYHSGEPHVAFTRLSGSATHALPLPWYSAALVRQPGDGNIQVESLSLAGRHGLLQVRWRGQRYSLGAVAVLYPTYRARGPSIGGELKELLAFFFVLFFVSGGIVLFTVMQLVTPIRKLEVRAEAMARGDLKEVVSSGGEGDEIGRLTFALEEMRRALQEKLRSTEEINVELEGRVAQRTGDLAAKNQELADTLRKLTRAQDELVRSEKMASIGQLVAGIAHEINNPVNAMVNTVEPLRRSLQDMEVADKGIRERAKEDLHKMLRVIQRGAERTKDIVQALHMYSRTDEERVVDFDLNRSIEGSLELLRHTLGHRVKIERNYGDVGRIRGHLGQLNQVFMNLLANAVQAVSSVEKGRVSVETIAEEAEVTVRVQDNGSGIAPEVLPRIFDPFFTTKEVGEGTGLGLSIVHRIVERHGGSIQVESTVGVGTTFIVTLPTTIEIRT